MKSTVAFPVCWVTWIVSPDTEAIIPLTHALPFADADGDDVAAELVGPAAVEGFVVFDAPHAATDSAVAPVSVRIANRVSRAGGKMTDHIEVLSDRRPLWPPAYATLPTIGGAAECRLAARLGASCV